MSKSVLITGASSGIGEALASEFARRGYRIALVARRIEKLQQMQQQLQAAGSPQAVARALDLRKTNAIAPVIDDCAAALGGLDIVIANAGVAYAQRVGHGTLEQMLETIEVDLIGALATVDAAVRHFRVRGHGQVVGITSVARYRGLPGFGAYSATKQGLHRYLQALRIESLDERITVTELAPGYIDTPMNRDSPSRPFVVSVDRAAVDMVDKIERGVDYATVPTLPWALLGRLMQVLPDRLLRIML